MPSERAEQRVSLLLYGGTLPLLIRRLQVRSPDLGEVRSELTELMAGLSDAATTSVGPADELVIEGQPIAPEVIAEVATRYRKLRTGQSEPTTSDTLTHGQQLTAVGRL